jgi:PAS domain S-box-containing protein
MPVTSQKGRQVEVLLDALLDQCVDHAVLLLDPEGRVIWANSGAERIFGRPAADLVGYPSSAHFVEEDVEKGIPDYELDVARSSSSAEDDRWTLRPDGSRFWASGLTYALRGREGELLGYGKILQNRTDWKQQLEALKNQVDRLSKLDENKNTVIATFAHELRNPLAPLLNAAHMLREGVPIQYPVQLVERQVDFLRRLVDDLLETTRIHAGKVQLRRERLVLQEVVLAAVETVRPLLDRKSHRLEVLQPAAPISIEGDAARLQQVFTNLLANAGKYTPAAGRICIKATTEGNEAVVRVEDDGQGIAPEELTHIFDLFVQLHTPPQAAEGGVGIGLSLVKELVGLHSGTVQANSDGIGKGSEFTVRLPALCETA